MSRFTRALTRLTRTTHLVSSMALDLGSTTTRVVLDGTLVYKQATAFALHTESKAVVALGDSAAKLLGKVPRSLKVVFPVSYGRITDPRLCRYYLKALRQEALSRRGRVLDLSGFWGVASDLSPVEREVVDRCLSSVKLEALKPKEKAEALSARIEHTSLSSKPVCVVDIGGQTTEVVLVMQNKPVASTTFSLGGVSLTEIIQQVVVQEHHCQLGWQTAERVKQELVTFSHDQRDKIMIVRGKDIVQQVAKSVTLQAGLFSKTIEKEGQDLVSHLQLFFTEQPSEMVAQVLENGLFLTGGGSQVKGLGKYLSEELGCPIVLSKTPEVDVVSGLIQVNK